MRQIHRDLTDPRCFSSGSKRSSLKRSQLEGSKALTIVPFCIVTLARTIIILAIKEVNKRATNVNLSKKQKAEKTSQIGGSTKQYKLPLDSFVESITNRVTRRSVEDRVLEEEVMKTYLEPVDIELMERATSCLRDRLLIRVLFRLGCRVSEALALKVSDIDFERGTATIHHLKTRIKLSCTRCKPKR